MIKILLVNGDENKSSFVGVVAVCSCLLSEEEEELALGATK
jgi:hypothetical protein